MKRQDVLLILAFVFIVGGVAAISWRAGLIVAGVLLGALFFATDWGN